ncbi:hypothetical protein [Algoriphagus aquimarinus]|uniref:hypothetical protein n=1 Tax=Algoriphagus aquimarinus TaxID=237018 RepID=UPI0030D952E5|tara:strand:- start:2471 stop:3331 length:861 start_codon:yes stop_codon:yes gene_type:complete
MKEQIEEFKNYLPALTLLATALGYIYLKFFYSQFDIEIEYYTNITDIILFVIAKFIDLSLAFIIIEILTVYPTLFIIESCRASHIKSKLKQRNFSKEVVLRIKKISQIKKSDGLYSIISLILILILSAALTMILSFPQRIFIYVIPILGLKFFLMIPKKAIKEQKEIILIVIPVIVLTLAISFFIRAVVESGDIVNNQNYKALYFNSKGTNYDTRTDSLNFIGETSNYLFIYNSKNKESYTFNKSSIERLSTINILHVDGKAEEYVDSFENDVKSYFKFRKREKKD